MPISKHRRGHVRRGRRNPVSPSVRATDADDLAAMTTLPVSPFGDFDHIGGEQIRDMMAKAIIDAGIDPALAYAYRKTGLILAERNRHLFSRRQLRQWDAAILEYQRLN